MQHNLAPDVAPPWQLSDLVGEALVDGLPFFSQSRCTLKDLLKARDCLQQPLSHSVSEAQAFVQAREDDKKKQQAKKDKSKSSTPASLLESCPGAEPGGESTKSAFWLFMEVRQHLYLIFTHSTTRTTQNGSTLQAYFRDLTKEDLHVLLPDFKDPREDPAYKVPPIGPHFSPDDLIMSPRATRGVKVMGAGQHSKKMLVMLLARSNALLWTN